jgi:hypothetical protein
LHEGITVIWSLIFLLGVKIMYLIGGIDLFRAGGVVLAGETIVMNLHNSLEVQRERDDQWM